MALDVSDDECLLVPAFTVGGAEVEDRVLVHKNRYGMPDDAIYVTLDNSTCISWRGRSDQGHNAYWMVCENRRWPKNDLPAPAPGRMCNECLIDVVKGLNALRRHRGDIVSPRVGSLIDVTLAQLAQEIQSNPSRLE